MKYFAIAILIDLLCGAASQQVTGIKRAGTVIYWQSPSSLLIGLLERLKIESECVHAHISSIAPSPAILSALLPVRPGILINNTENHLTLAIMHGKVLRFYFLFIQLQ